MLIGTLVLMYASIKFLHLITAYNPNINDYYVDVVKDEELNLNEFNFRIAFTIEDLYAPRELKNDETFVKWVFRVNG